MSKIQNSKLPIDIKMPFVRKINNNLSAVLGMEQSTKLHQGGFTVLEVLVSFSILALILMALYQSYSSSIFVLSSTTNLWNAMSHRSRNGLPTCFCQSRRVWYWQSNELFQMEKTCPGHHTFARNNDTSNQLSIALGLWETRIYLQCWYLRQSSIRAKNISEGFPCWNY